MYCIIVEDTIKSAIFAKKRKTEIKNEIRGLAENLA